LLSADDKDVRALKDACWLACFVAVAASGARLPANAFIPAIGDALRETPPD
jgi:hypothetical protein